MMARKRTFLGFGAFVLLEIAILLGARWKARAWFRRLIPRRVSRSTTTSPV